jgi:hypothetical protein
VTVSDSLRGYRRAALWGLLASKVLGAWGLAWDIQWHMTIGRDSFWIAPHLMIYSSVVGGLLLGGGVLALERRRAIAPTRGFLLATLGLVIVVLAAPIDDLWHRLFGIDVTLWSPPHLLALFGSAISTLGCVLIATEVYPQASVVGRIALVVAGGVLYGGIRVTLDPSWLLAYSYGGVLFHTFAILGTLTLPLALVPAARMSGMRWAPVFAVLVSVGVGLGGQQVSRAGFAIVAPVSFIEEEIAKDPTSALAVGREIATKNRAAPAGWLLRLLLPLIPAALLSAVDARRRPLAATLVYGVALFAVYAWFLTTLPAYAPLAPGPGSTAMGLLLVLVCGGAGGLAARWLSERLVEAGAERDWGREAPPGELRVTPASR